jgi:hypothetical protein
MSSPEVAKELAKALGVEEVTIQIRQTEEKKASVIDAIRLFTGLNANHAAEKFRDLVRRYPDLNAKIVIYKFAGRRQRETPITDLATLYEILMLLPGRMAAQCRRHAAQLLIRYLGGDLSLIAEVEENRKLQERLAAEDPNHPLRQFGVAVEAAMEPHATEVVHPQDSQADPKGDFLYGMKVPGESLAVKVGRTKDIAQRERALSCGQVALVRALVVFPGAGPLEKHVHRRLQRHQIRNEVFKITVEELKDTVLLAREDYAREQHFEELRMQMSSPDLVDDEVEDIEPASNKRRRLAEDLDLEERQVALDHIKAMNCLKIEEQRATMPLNIQGREMDLREREVGVKEREVGVKEREVGVKERELGVKERELGVKEREARLMMEVEEWKARMLERAAQLQQKPPPVPVDLRTTMRQTSNVTSEGMAQNPPSLASPAELETTKVTMTASKLLGL